MDDRRSVLAGPNCVCVIAALAALCSIFHSFSAKAGDSLRYRGGLRNSPGPRKLNAKQLDTILTILRDKAGLLEMRFDEDGFLALGDQTRISGGSATARALLNAAVTMTNAVEMESHTNSPKIAFARLAEPVAYRHCQSGAQIDVFPLEIDFSDFLRLRGDPQALAAFDIGFVILHELGHAALGLRDASGDPRGLGECETLINRIRRELNLPERQTYVAQTYAAPPFSSIRGPTRLAQLVFTRGAEKAGGIRVEKFDLRWETSLVGGPIVETENRRPKTKDRRLGGRDSITRN